MFKKKQKAGRRVTSVVTDSDSDSDYTTVQTQPASSGGDVHILSDLNPYAEEYVPGNRRPSIISISEVSSEDVAGVQNSAEGEGLSGEEGSEDEHINNSDRFLSAEESHSSNDEAPDSSVGELGTDAKNGKVHRPRR